MKQLIQDYDMLRRFPPVVIEADTDALPLQERFNERFNIEAGKAFVLPPGYHARVLHIPCPFDTWLVDECIHEYTGGA